MKKLVIFCSVILILAAVVPVLPTASDREIYDMTLRLHVLANSDTDADQALKLAVRDRLLVELDPLLTEVSDRESAEQIVLEHADALREAAEEVIVAQGYEYPVTLTLGREYYPRREYEGVTLPAGRYPSLQVKIGESAGQNWWCVLFPTLCTSSAEPREKLAQAGFTVGQIRLITDSRSTRYKIKFRLLELFERE